MSVGERIKERLVAHGMSQSELARRVSLTQPAINALIRGSSRTSLNLHRIARALSTTPAYLEGEIDDPDEGAPPPAPEPQVIHVMLPVALPAAPAMAAMFEGLLLSLGDWQAMPVHELAQELATLLPTGLGVLRGPLRYAQSVDDDDLPALLEDRATDAPAPRRARRG